MKTKLALIALLITASSVFAMFGTSEKKDSTEDRAQTMISRFDANSSGDLDLDELTAAEQSRQEMEKALDPESTFSDPAEVAETMLKEHDADGNEALNIDELKAAIE